MAEPENRYRGTDTVPLYALYGEETATENTSFIHIEEIAARSRIYNWEIDTHTHRGLLQAVVIFDGGGEILLDDQSMRVVPPSVISIPPATIHAFKFEPETHGYVLTISEALLFAGASRQRHTLFDALFLEPRVIGLDSAPATTLHIEHLLDHLLEEFGTPGSGHSALIAWLAKSVFLLIERQRASGLLSDRASNDRTSLFTQFRTLVEQHYLAHWSVPQYAEALGVTASKLNRTCKALAGCSAFEVTQERLLLESRRRLIYIAAPIQTLAYELGFDDPGYFNRFFKRRTGQTPAAFRRTQHECLA